jgi:peptidoglycan/xylan/chitin deacetylase (PgdA/CDA1 family)
LERFDDGPLLPSPALYSFLKENKQIATHFMIGLNILTNPDIFLSAYDAGDDLAVHTWTHPYMTSLSNEAVLAELGWTMQIIHDSTGGRLPRFWRPPYGDADDRIRAIAKNVFGLSMIIWNQEYVNITLLPLFSRLIIYAALPIGHCRQAAPPKARFCNN